MRLSACGRKRGIKGPVCGGSQRSSPGPLPQKGMRFEKGEGFLSQTTAAQENKMGVKPIFGLLLSMALPSMASMLVQALYNIVDGIYVSRIHPDALTAVSLASPVQILMISLSVGTCVGVNSLISRRLGQKNQADADAAATHGLLLSLLSWAACAVFGLLCTNLFFRLFSPSESIFNYGVEYLWVVTVFSAGMFVEISVEKTFQATGSMMTSMVLQLIGAVTNIILDPILIFGLLGAPALGVRGAAIATVIGQSLAGVIGLVLLVRGKNAVTVTLRGFRWNGRIVRDIYTVGLPSILMQSIGSVTAMGFNRILMGLSEGAVWVMGTYSKLENFLFMPLFGLTHGVLPLTGYNFGAKNRERMLQTMRYGLIIGISMMAVGMLIFWIFPRQSAWHFCAHARAHGDGRSRAAHHQPELLPGRRGYHFVHRVSGGGQGGIQPVYLPAAPDCDCAALRLGALLFGAGIRLVCLPCFQRGLHGAQHRHGKASVSKLY